MAKKFLNLPTSDINDRLAKVPELVQSAEQVAQLAETVSNKQDKEPGKGLSTNDFTNEAQRIVSQVNVKNITIDNDTLKVTLFDGRTLDFKGGEGIKYVVKKTNEDNTIEVFFLLTDDLDVINEWREAGYDAQADIVKCSYVANNSGGGGGGTASDYTMEARIVRQPNDAMVMGAENSLTFSYIVYYGKDKTDIETGNGKSQVFVNGTHVLDLDLKLKSNEDGTPREYTINLGEHLTSAENTVELRVQNADGTLTRQWVWNIAAYSLTVSFAESYLVAQTEPKSANWQLPILVRGSNGILHVKVDNTELPTVQVQAGSTTNVRIDADAELAEGAHNIEAWCENDTFGFESEHIFTGFIKAGNTDAVVVAANAPREAMQYGAIAVPYYAYLPSVAVGTEVSVYIAVISGGKTIITNEQKALVGEGNITPILSANVSLMSTELAADATMVIAINDIQTQHTFAISQSDVELTEASECKVYYNFQGKANSDADVDNLTSSYEGEQTSRIIRDWSLNDGNGFRDNGFVISTGKQITLELAKKFFSEDFGANGKMTGKTFAIELMTKDIVDTDAIVCDCMSDDCGFRIYANRIEIKRAGSTDTIVAPFPENEHVRVGFVIDGTQTHCEADTGQGSKIEKDYNLGYIYIDGCVTRLFEYGSDSWQQETPKDITIGSLDAGVTAYIIRVFDKALTVTEWLNTYAFDTPNVNDKLDIATRNAIFDNQGEVSMALIQKRLPHTAIHVWEMESIPPTKKVEVPILSSSFSNPDWDGQTLAQASYEAGAHTCKADGTSSEGYPLPFKNIGETLDGITVKYVTGDEHSAVYSLTEGTVGEKDFVDKINFASSEGILNICAMNMYQKILLGCARNNTNLLTKQQLRQYEEGGIDAVTFRQSLSGLPEIGFRRYTENGKKVTKYWSLFNLINNKYSGTLYGLNTKTGKDLVDGKHAEMWEVDENVNFFNQEFTENSVDSDGNLVPSTGVNDVKGFTTLYYCRVPKKSAVNTNNGYGVATTSVEASQANEETKNLRRLHNWIYSVNPWIAEQYKTINGSYRTLPEPWTSSSNQTFPLDTPQYRRTRFLEEYQHYLNSDNACFYFVFCTWILGMDSMDKNMTIVIDDITADEPKASFSLRDTDSWGRFNNTGRLIYPYYAEWGDTYNASTGEIGRINGITADGKPVSDLEGSTQIFNGAMSGLWALVSDALKEKVQSMYQQMRSAGLNDKVFLEMWQSFRTKWCDALYNYDAVKRYASTGNLDMAYGDKWALMRDFFVKRTRYMDAKYSNCQPDHKTTMRFNSVPVGVWIETTQPTYASFEYGANNFVNERNINGETSFLATPSTIKQFNNATCYIDDADLVNGFGGYVLDQYGNKVKAGIEALGQVAFTQANLANLSKLKEFVMAYTADAPNTYQQAEGFSAFAELKNFRRLRRLIITNVVGFKEVIECNSEYLEEIDLTGTECSGIVLNACKSGCRIALPSTAGSITINSDAIDSYAIFKSIYENGGSVNRVSVTGTIDWQDASANVVLMITKANNINLKGTINITDQLDGKTKLLLMAAFGDIDNPQNDVYVTYTKVGGEALMRISGDAYVSIEGEYQYLLSFLPPTFNDIKNIGWSLSANADGYATIDNNGKMTVTAVPAEDSEMVMNRQKINVIATITKVNGEKQSQSFPVGLYKQKEKIEVNVSYGSGVESRADSVYIQLEDDEPVAYELVDNVTSLILPYNIRVKITFPQLEDARNIEPIEFTTGQDTRVIEIKFKYIKPDFMWILDDGTEVDVEDYATITNAQKRHIIGLYCDFVYNIDEYGNITNLSDIDCAFLIPRTFLDGSITVGSMTWGSNMDMDSLPNVNSFNEAMKKPDFVSLNSAVLNECNLATDDRSCVAVTYCQKYHISFNGMELSGCLPSFVQMYLISENYDKINNIVANMYDVSSPSFNKGYWWTVLESINHYGYWCAIALIDGQLKIDLGGGMATTKDNRYKVLPIFQFKLS